MKKLIPIVAIALIFIMSGCVAIKKQNNIENQIENLVYDAPADRLYTAAVKYMGASSTGKNQAATAWVTHDKVFNQSRTYQEKYRYLIKVTAQGKNKSILRVHRQHMSNFVGGEWQKTPYMSRSIDFEHKILKSFDSAKAAEIERNAIAASKK